MSKPFITTGSKYVPLPPSNTPPWEAGSEDAAVEPASKAAEDDSYTMGEFWAEVKPVMKARSMEKRAQNRSNSAHVLSGRGIEYEVKNGGAHLIVTHAKGIVDFWPGTGRWRTRTDPIIDRRGVFQLVDYLEGCRR